MARTLTTCLRDWLLLFTIPVSMILVGVLWLGLLPFFLLYWVYQQVSRIL